MEHLHSYNLVIAVSDQLARAVEHPAAELMHEGRWAVSPIAGYRDDRDEAAVQIRLRPEPSLGITEA